MRCKANFPRIDNLLLRALVWGFIGLVYGFIFVVAAELLRPLVGTPWHLLLATTATASLTALFYASMRLSVIIANLLFVTTLLYLAFGRDAGCCSITSLILIAALLGMLVGGAYGWHDKQTKICCADAKIVAGLVTGAAGLPLTLLALWIFDAPDRALLPWLVALLAPLSGLLYVGSARWFVERCQNLLPPFGDGALVGFGVGAVTGLLFVVLIGTLEPQIAGSSEEPLFLGRVYEVLGESVALSAFSCLLAGAARSWLRVPWYNL